MESRIEPLAILGLSPRRREDLAERRRPGHVDARPSSRIGLDRPQDLPHDRRSITKTEQQVTEQMAERVALGPPALNAVGRRSAQQQAQVGMTVPVTPEEHPCRRDRVDQRV